MALDPSVLALTAQPPKLEDPIQSYQKLLGVRQAQQAQIAGQQQIQSGALELQQRQMQLKQQQVINQAYQQATTVSPDGTPNVDMNKMLRHLSENGAGTAIPGVVESLTKAQKAKSDLIEQQSKIQNSEADYLGHTGYGIMKSGGDPTLAIAQLQDAYTTYKDPKILQAIQAIRQAPNPQTVQSVLTPFIQSSPGALKVIQEQQTADAATKTAQSRETTAQTQQDKFNIEKPGLQAAATQAGVSQAAGKLARAGNLADYTAGWNALPDDQKAVLPNPSTLTKFGPNESFQVLKAGTTAEQQVTDTRKQQELAQGAQRVGIEAQNSAVNRAHLGVAMYNAGLDENGKPKQYVGADGQPKNIDPIAGAIANYKLAPAAARSYSANRGLMEQVLAANPDFDIAKYETRQAVAKGFADDKPNSSGGQVLALNTLVHHADLYQEVAKALNNGSFVPGNAVYNSVAQAFGKAPPTNANLVAQFLAGETAKAAGGTQAEGEINRILGSLSKNASPEGIKGAGDTILQIAAGRMVPLKEKADAADLTKNGVVNVLGPDAKAILTKNGYDPNTLKQAGSGGSAASGYKVGDSVTYNGAPHKIKEIKPNGKLVLEQ